MGKVTSHGRAAASAGQLLDGGSEGRAVGREGLQPNEEAYWSCCG